MQHRNTRYFGYIATKSFLGFLLYGASVSAVAQNFPDIGYCTHCSSAGFALAAEQAAPLHSAVHPVYVIDRATGQVQYFDVEVWWDCGGNIPQTEGSDEFRSLAKGVTSIQSNCIQRQANPGSGSASIKSAMMDAYAVAMTFRDALASSISAGDLGLDIGSAVDLIGPGSGNLNRNALRNQINNHYSSLPGVLAVSLEEIARGIVKRYLGDGGMVNGAVLTITFPDGTSIKVKVENVLDVLGAGLEVHLELEVLTDSAQGPNLHAVPQEANEFDGFNYSGNGSTAMALFLLADRFEESIVCEFSCDATGSTCTLSCQRQ